MARLTAWVVAVLFGVLSLYGWWFYFSAGPAHGPGAELGLLAGTIAIVAVGIAGWLQWRERRR